MAFMALLSMIRIMSQGLVSAKHIDVNEFQIAQALLAGHTELLSQEVESRHLFTMCMQFGHEETASEMLRQGVPGCKVEAFHLGPYALQPKFIGEPLELLLGI